MVVAEVDGRLHVAHLNLLVLGKAAVVEVGFLGALIVALVPQDGLINLGKGGIIGIEIHLVVTGVACEGRKLCRREIHVVHGRVPDDGVVHMGARFIFGGIVLAVSLYGKRAEFDTKVQAHFQMLALHQAAVKEHGLQIGHRDGRLHVGRLLHNPPCHPVLNTGKIEHVVQQMHLGSLVFIGIHGDHLLHVQGIVVGKGGAQTFVGEGLAATVGRCLSFVIVELGNRDGLYQFTHIVGNPEHGAAVHLGEVLVNNERKGGIALVHDLPALDAQPVGLTLGNSDMPLSVALDGNLFHGALHIGLYAMGDELLVHIHRAGGVLLLAGKQGGGSQKHGCGSKCLVKKFHIYSVLVNLSGSPYTHPRRIRAWLSIHMNVGSI